MNVLFWLSAVVSLMVTVTKRRRRRRTTTTTTIKGQRSTSSTRLAAFIAACFKVAHVCQQSYLWTSSSILAQGGVDQFRYLKYVSTKVFTLYAYIGIAHKYVVHGKLLLAGSGKITQSRQQR